MKKLLSILLVSAVLFASCSSDDDDPSKTQNPYNPAITGNITKADRPNWKVVEGLSYSCMCLFVDEYGLPCPVDSADILASFVDGECRGVASPVHDTAAGYWRFNLAVNSTPDDEIRTDIPVELRYFSACQKGIYTASTFQYQDGRIVGSATKGNGYVPAWN